VKRARTLADRDEMPPRNLMPSRRPAHAVVTVASPDDLESALKALKQQRAYTGLHRAMRNGSTTFAYYKPGDRKRMKSGRHRAAMRKVEAKRRIWELKHEEKRTAGAAWRRKYEGGISPAA
jgi:hypothetical protein